MVIKMGCCESGGRSSAWNEKDIIVEASEIKLGYFTFNPSRVVLHLGLVAHDNKVAKNDFIEKAVEWDINLNGIENPVSPIGKFYNHLLHDNENYNCKYLVLCSIILSKPDVSFLND